MSYSKGAVQHGGVIQKGGAVQHGGSIQKGGVYQKSSTIVQPPVPSAVDSALKARQGVLSVSVPGDARVFVNGAHTTSGGTERNYVSRGLTAGASYTYSVRAELDRDGETVEETKTVVLRAGETSSLSFDFDAERAATALTVHVPEDATIELAGTTIEGSGPVRIFKTDRLATGQEWAGYTVVVSVNRDGQSLSRSQTITLTGGEDRDLSFDFDAPQVAMAN
jgi:uncharacterized protein (TIGR03000 family)